MKFNQPQTIENIASLINAKVIGSTNKLITGINEIHKVEAGDLVFVDHPKYYETCLNSAATFIIINKELPAPEGKALLLTDNPFESYCTIVNYFQPFNKPEQTVNSTQIGEGTFIYPTAFIGNNVSIGSHCIIHPNVSIMDNTVIGNHVVIQAGTVLGSDAFYYNTKKDRAVWYKKMPSCGRVVIEDDVEIGANCTIDKGVSHDTKIGLGSKLDNMIHIGHDTVVGKNCLIAANVVIAGCVNIEDAVTIWGGCIINKTLTIGSGAVLLGRTGVSKDIPGNITYYGAPAQEARAAHKDMIWIKRIPALWDKVMKG
jgi:UDP-3-O-[3-hydroxymyristoyl] glucosamine N-acyltransferase